MKKTLFIGLFVFVLCFALVGCGSKDSKKEYDKYIGYQFEGTDVWGNAVTVKIKSLENGKLTWTYTDVYILDEKSVKLYNEITSDFKNDSTSFKVSKEIDNLSFNYSGTLSFKDGNLIIKLEDGQLITKSAEGTVKSHQVESLSDIGKTIELSKASKNS